jgi:hypothetical protein
MYKNSDTSGAFLNRNLVQTAKLYAAQHGLYLAMVIDACARRLLARKDLDTITFPVYQPESRKETTMILLDRDTLREIKLTAVRRDSTVRAVLRYAVEQAFEAVARGETLPVRTPAGLPRAPVNGLVLSPTSLATAKAAATQRGITPEALIEALIGWATAAPHVLDLVLGPTQAAPAPAPSAQAEAAAEVARRFVSTRKTKTAHKR